MTISQEDAILIFKKISIKAVWCTVNFPTTVGNLEHRQSAENPQDGYNVRQPGSGSSGGLRV